MLVASKPCRQEADGLQGISQEEAGHGNPAQFIPR
jgi:hypothetical protein